MDHSIQTIQEEDDQRLWDELYQHENSELLRHNYNNNNSNNRVDSAVVMAVNHSGNNDKSNKNTTSTSSSSRNGGLSTPPWNHHHRQPQQQQQQKSSSMIQQINNDIQRVSTIVYDTAQRAYHQQQYQNPVTATTTNGNHHHPYHPRSQPHSPIHPHHNNNISNGDYYPINDTTSSTPTTGTLHQFHHRHHGNRSFNTIWQRWLDWQTSMMTGTTTSTTNNNNNNNNNAYFAEFGIPNPAEVAAEESSHNYSNNNNYFRFLSTTANDDDATNDNKNNNQNGYIHIPSNNTAGGQRQFPYRENDGYAFVSDLDVYFQNIYSYYYHRGYVPILTRRVSELMTIYGTFGLSIILFVYIDWEALSSCTDETTCHQNFTEQYIKHRPFRTLSLYNIWIVLYMMVFGMYCIASSLSLIHTLQIAKQSKTIYENKLGISSQKLQYGAIDWDRDIVQKFITLQESGQYRIIIPNIPQSNNNTGPTTGPTAATTSTTTTSAINGITSSNGTMNGEHTVEPSTTAATTKTNGRSNQQHHPNEHRPNHNMNALMIANRILRKENFMIALFNRQVLNLSPISYYSSSRHQQSTNVPRFFCASIEWSIYYCVLNFLFNHKYQIRPSFYLDPAALRRRFQLCGIMHIVLMPFLLFFMTLYFGLQNVYDWKSTKQYFGPREWSISAKWTFREFNELPHFFERRLAPSYDAAETYVDLFGSNEYVSALGRICVFIGGSFGAVLLALAAMNDAILLHVKIGDWNLLWYGGMFGILYSAGKAMIPKAVAQPKSARNLYAEMNSALTDVAKYTHYYPDIWVNRGWDYATYSAFSSMFQYKVRLFLTEITSLILAPYILCVSLANSAESICELVLSCRAEMPGVGDVCGFASFDFSTFQDERTATSAAAATTTTMQDVEPIAYSEEPIVATGQSLSESILQTGNVEESIRQFPKPRARCEKMRKSFVTFQESHPSWTAVTEDYCHMPNIDKQSRHVHNIASSALLSEVDLHRIAAARQLETLERIQEGRLSSSKDYADDLLLSPNIINECYIPLVCTEAQTINARQRPDPDVAT